MINEMVNIIGLGGIGSPTALEVAHYGCSCLVLWDSDVVESHNPRNQIYDQNDVGLPKVEAIARRIMGVVDWQNSQGNQMSLVLKQEKVSGQTDLSGIVIVAVDNIESRREIFAACALKPSVALFIEAAAGENVGVVRALNSLDQDQAGVYEKLLKNYSAGGQAPCVTPGMGGMFASLVVKWLDRLNRLERPFALTESSIFYNDEPTIVTEHILG